MSRIVIVIWQLTFIFNENREFPDLLINYLLIKLSVIIQ
jgi:hypothetical protein